MKTKSSKATMKVELSALAALPDDQIDLSDIPELSEEFWQNAMRGKFYWTEKQQRDNPSGCDVNDPPR